jgi:DNA-directed RNA polymerase subunit beta'
MSFFDDKKPVEFDALRLSVASPELIHQWSYGEVEKPETINYRTQKPEKGGLFAEEIFGPSKDWECYCGKYKKIRYKGIVCDKCGVEVTRAVVRRERMGHIDLAVPVSHIWFLRGVPSKIGLILDLAPQAMERVIYFADFIITRVDEDLKKETLEQIRQEFKAKRKKIIAEFDQQLNVAKARLGQDRKDATDKQADAIDRKMEDEAVRVEDGRKEKLDELDEALALAEQELKEVKAMKIISEHTYQDLSLKYGHIFDAGIGAEAIQQLLREVDLEKVIAELTTKLVDASGLQREKALKRQRLLKSFVRNKMRPEWMVLNVIPVIPPDLRPMVPLDGGRFATSDLNDLYRRIINRNNRLRQLQDLNAPEVITRNEKRMLQEAVDALIDNSARHGKTVAASTGQKRMLKSLADILKGKQGRFRQNLLGKRIDYSGRSVIVVGPNLRLHQCGLPKRMALELFKPFVISQLIRAEYVHNVRSANRFIETGRDEVWDILENIVKDATVLLNRAPTLHRLGIQAFKPILIEGKAIQVHPLVCEAFNADFDGDQLAVHVPLTAEARWEAENLMLASKNLLKPATGDPIAKPTKDIIWGCYYMTMLKQVRPDARVFASHQDAILAYESHIIAMQEKIMVRRDGWLNAKLSAIDPSIRLYETTVGRILFNQVLPDDFPYQNTVVDTKLMRQIISDCLERYPDRTADLLDAIKKLGFRYLTRSGFSWGMDDVPRIPEKNEIIAQAERDVEEVGQQFEMGLLTESERHAKVIETWMGAKDKIVSKSRDTMDMQGPIYSMVESGARGSWSQLIQIVGMKGLVTNPAGEIIELPVKGNFKEGFDVLEYFISTHGARKGLTDTALRTANAGYLTRRLIDVSQDLIIYEDDCGDTEGTVISRESSERIGLKLAERVRGRIALEDIVDPADGKTVIVAAGQIIDNHIVLKLGKLDLPHIHVRSVMTCKAIRGFCKQCYGLDLASSKLVATGTAVGIIAAQSIGEPGTQLTMRTFHTGGVAGVDITQGLPRVEEIFECRPPKHRSFIADVGGRIRIDELDEASRRAGQPRTIAIEHEANAEERYPLAITKKSKLRANVEVTDGQTIKKGELILTTSEGEKMMAKADGVVAITADEVVIRYKEMRRQAYQIPPEFHLQVKDGDLVGPGDMLTDGSVDLRQLFRLKGKIPTQKYVIEEIQKLYTSQGQKLNDKHIEIITRQMFSRYLIIDPGDSELLVGERITQHELDDAVVKLKKSQRQPSVEALLLGITKVALSTSSFLSAVSFQETSRVLINAAVEGRIDRLEGLKENVIIGRLIPAGTGYKNSPAASKPPAQV